MKDLLFIGLPIVLVLIGIVVVALHYIEPAPPNHLSIATAEEESDLFVLGKEYQDILKDDGVRLDVKASDGPYQNLHQLEDDKTEISAAFVQDGLGSPEKQPDVVSLGSLYYEPLWIFYRGKTEITHFSQFEHKKMAVGRKGHGTHILANRLFRLSKVDPASMQFVDADAAHSAEALKKGEVDAGLFMLSAENPIIKDLAQQKDLRIMNVAQAEAIARKDATFHHLILPRGALDLKADIPNEDTNIVASTATLLVRDDLHPALAYLLLKAAAQIHSNPGLFEKRGEFPTNKDDVFPLSDDALQFYKTGGPFWQRYVPYWMAAWMDRFVLLVIPIMAFVLPMIRFIPKMYHWRLRSRIYQRYGELKFLETQIAGVADASGYQDLLKQLDQIEVRVNKMKMPQNFSEYIYSLKGHIQFVRDRIEKTVEIPR